MDSAWSPKNVTDPSHHGEFSMTQQPGFSIDIASHHEAGVAAEKLERCEAEERRRLGETDIRAIIADEPHCKGIPYHNRPLPLNRNPRPPYSTPTVVFSHGHHRMWKDNPPPVYLWPMPAFSPEVEALKAPRTRLIAKLRLKMTRSLGQAIKKFEEVLPVDRAG
ncbi:hypothetical protein BKA70DRAFT_1492029 [Coprinopsis sp. MPI-PUGE-AT-0042]|nr:hypothetical protein BKA70DRAFT_1492029 [Coprinopsis sp. MPI-PUGE-AT-0042]